VEAARRFFQDEARPLDDPRTRLRLGDGRVHLALGDRAYDVVISQPGNPWMAGSSALFTREAFADLRARLAPGGVVAVWLQGWMSPEAVRMLLATFRSVFPAADLWEPGVAGHYVLTAYLEPRSLDPVRLEARMAAQAVAEDLARYRIRDAADLLGRFVLGPQAVARLARGAPLSTDDLDLVAPLAGRDLVANRWPEVLADLAAAREPVSVRLPPDLEPQARARFLDRYGPVREARLRVEAALVARAAAEALAQAGRSEEAAARSRQARARLEQARALNPREPFLPQEH
jgi:hypothetical protein